MSKKYEEMAKVLHQEAFGNDIFSLVIETKDIAKKQRQVSSYPYTVKTARSFCQDRFLFVKSIGKQEP